MIRTGNAIYFDMDGTIANLYGVEGWLEDIVNESTRPYDEATVMVHMSALARQLNKLQKEGYIIGIVSWLAKGGSVSYNEQVKASKELWLKKHLASVSFDEIHIVPYGTPKETVVNHPMGYLFDDEKPNRENWNGVAFDVENILDILREIAL